MTISNEETPRIQYAGPITPGTVLPFPYSYSSDEQVKAQISDDDKWELNVDYTVSESSSITTVTNVPSGKTLTIS